jgi:hypothetical protein
MAAGKGRKPEYSRCRFESQASAFRLRFGMIGRWNMMLIMENVPMGTGAEPGASCGSRAA